MAEEPSFSLPPVRRWHLVLVAAGFCVILFFGTLVRFAADFLWFRELGFSEVFWTSFLSKAGLGLLGAGVFWLVAYANLRWARTTTGPQRVRSDQIDAESPLDALKSMGGMLHPLVTFGGLVMAALMGARAAVAWEMVLRRVRAVPFGAADPLFGVDIGFYVFEVPFLQFVFSFLFLTVVFAAIGAVLTYAIRGRIEVTERGFWVGRDVKQHLAALLGCLVLLLGLHFHLQVFEIVSKQRALAPGAGYADVNAYLGFLKALRFVAVIAAGLIWAGIRYPGRMLGVAGAGLVVGFAVVGMGYRHVVQRFHVDPNELEMETPYINWAIEYTRRAYGLEDIPAEAFSAEENLTLEKLRRNAATIENVRLWDHGPLLTTYAQLQEIRSYYQFMDVDNDRYVVDGEYRQVMLSPRELLPKNLPSRNWINEHLMYTHGYGICLGPVSRISEQGLPEFFVQDIPPRATGGIKVSRPGIYYGESDSGYAIVKTESQEFDYPSGQENVYTTYEGTGGVPVGGLLRRALFAMYFREFKILLTREINPDSRIMYNRRVLDRVDKVAPFLHCDPDPYMVIADDGRLYWMLDGYTTTNRYPYSFLVRNMGNYIRNSVKIVVDAYNGDVTFYVIDPGDPLIQTYARIFPSLFTPIGKMPADLRRHIRYPIGLFSLQALVYATYHMTDPTVFYNKEDLWAIPKRKLDGRFVPMEPYYTIMKLAGAGSKEGRTRREEFILMIPFTPANKKNMIAWMAARCDDPNYGKLLVYNFPKQRLVYGPQQIDNRIDQAPEISEQLSLWDQTGSRVIRGSLLVIPVEDSILYIQPLYLEAQGGGLPELRRVIAGYGNRIVMEENLEAALAGIFGGYRGAGPRRGRPAAPPAGSPNAELARRAARAFEDGKAALQKNDWQGYGRAMAELERLLREMEKQK